MAGGKVHPFSGFTLSICQLRPESRGYVRIQSRDPLAAPEMQPYYLSTELDRQTTVAGVRAARAIAGSPAMRHYVKREFKPGPESNSYEELLDFCRNSGQTIFHPTGTARMGRDAMAVVDARLRVHGIGGLRVVDCSAMPTLVSGNTNAPAIMMAEKAVDMIREDHARAALPLVKTSTPVRRRQDQPELVHAALPKTLPLTRFELNHPPRKLGVRTPVTQHPRYRSVRAEYRIWLLPAARLRP